ncbi:hypothetical protein DFA_08035 [Cavenderia fasciculata]|uniref:Transmembrane protein n=1 Tax=Cavenderia fasciculata TaxID=261658 RepID=F4Q4P5_CACFS|nr:uncharacterized protein DFA_08035 [Cavenderia fasciculata]EGG17054.1 hypothetical protein DFA_08035 [Cavenderia fasciculata]|eukprot:XP_004355538.1 hypothetical protein DFA_08035 [Cavenderia fasciculata]
MTEDIISLSIDIDKYKELISIGLKSILSLSTSTFILFYEILPNNPNKRIETFYKKGIEKIMMVYNEMETNNRITITQDIKEMAVFAEKSNKLCKRLAHRGVVVMLLRIMAGAEGIWNNRISHRSPLSKLATHHLYTRFEKDNIMMDCINLLNHILPYVKDDIPFDLLYRIIYSNSLSPTSYRLTCVVLRTMTLKPETIQPFIKVGMIRMVRFYLDNQFKSEYSQLEDYWLQITKIIYKDKEYYKHHFKSSVQDQSFIDEYYENGRFKLWILPTKELRVPPHNMLFTIISGGIGYYTGWLNTTALFVGNIYSHNLFSNTILGRLDSTLAKYLFCSFYASSLMLYYIFLLPTKGKIFYIVSTLISAVISSYQDTLVSRLKANGRLYKSFQQLYQTPHQNDDLFFENNHTMIINNKSDILDYQF